GVLYPRGGFGEIIAAIARLAEQNGVRILTGHRAARILVEGKRARGTTTRGVEARTPRGERKVFAADIVVSTADAQVTEQLLPPRAPRRSARWWRRRNPGPGAVLALLGVRGELPQLAHHTLFFTNAWEEGFDAIYGSTPRIPDPASLNVIRPSTTYVFFSPSGQATLIMPV